MGKVIIAIILIFVAVYALRSFLEKQNAGTSSGSVNGMGTLGKVDTSITDKAYQLIVDNAKGQWVPKWIVDEAIEILKTCYSPTDAGMQINNFMRVRGICQATFPRSMYRSPDTNTDEVVDYCIEFMSELECIRRRLPDELPEADLDAILNLAFTLYFFDPETTTYEQAQLTIMDMLTDYKKHVGILPE